MYFVIAVSFFVVYYYVFCCYCCCCCILLSLLYFFVVDCHCCYLKSVLFFVLQAEIHQSLLSFRQLLEVEQEKNAKMQQQLFEMTQKVMQFGIENANRSNRALGQMASDLAGLHNRVVSKHVQKSYDMGIRAVVHRRERDTLQEKHDLSRESAEKMLKEKRLSDLNVWEECKIKSTENPQVTSRHCRATTRRITKQLYQANKEFQGATKPLDKVSKVPTKTRDATPEVRTH